MAALAAIFYREGLIRATNFFWMFWDLLHPLAYLLIFGVGVNAALGRPPGLEGADYNGFFLAGVLGMGCFGVAANTSWGFFVDRDNGIFYEMLTYPLSRAQFLLGKMLFNVLLGVAQGAITVALAAAALNVRLRFDSLALLLAAVALGTAAWFCFYALFALKIRRNDTFNTVTSIYYFYFLFGSSVFYPIEPLPAWLRWTALANPLTWHVDVMRYATLGGEGARLWWEIPAFLVFGAVSFWLAVKALEQQ
jgi:ABC-2 type transport system permease protein